MATETQSGLSDHLRGVTVTTIACLAGVVAALASARFVGTAVADAASQQSLLIVVALVLAQFPILRVVGIDISEFGAKDYLYVTFMTFTLWFITFGVLLTEGVAL
ncbi:EMC6-like membrane protein [Halobellus sp. GM3]|uniref:EMC6-like membrane protein n=1 Tax=Halobellus sp. GM3 TaxID=3458410 RepID=UPI00403D5C21